MCEFKSGIIFKNRVELTPIYNESHSALLRKLDIEDSHLNAKKMFVRAELSPKNGDKTTDVADWKFKVDQDIVPDWYEQDSGRYEEEFRNAAKEWMKNKFITICGVSCVKIKEENGNTYYITTDKLFDSEFGNTNNYADSIVRKKLTESDFAKALIDEYGNKMVPISSNLLSLDGLDDYGTVNGDILAIPTLDLYRECRKNILSLNEWWYLSTPDSTPFSCGSGRVRYVGSDGCVSCNWCGSSGAVRPFFILQSSIFESSDKLLDSQYTGHGRSPVRD